MCAAESRAFSLSYDTEHAIATAIFELILAVCGMVKVLEGLCGKRFYFRKNETKATKKGPSGELFFFLIEQDPYEKSSTSSEKYDCTLILKQNSFT